MTEADKEAIVNVCDWLAGYIEGEADAAQADDLTEGLLRPLLCVLHPVHATVML